MYMIQTSYKQGCAYFSIALIPECRKKIKELSIIDKEQGGIKPGKRCDCIDKWYIKLKLRSYHQTQEATTTISRNNNLPTKIN